MRSEIKPGVRPVSAVVTGGGTGSRFALTVPVAEPGPNGWEMRCGESLTPVAAPRTRAAHRRAAAPPADLLPSIDKIDPTLVAEVPGEGLRQAAVRFADNQSVAVGPACRGKAPADVAAMC